MVQPIAACCAAAVSMVLLCARVALRSTVLTIERSVEFELPQISAQKPATKGLKPSEDALYKMNGQSSHGQHSLSHLRGSFAIVMRY